MNTPTHKVLKAAEPHRRALVARLRIRHLSQREIVQALQQQGNLNPVSGNPWSLGLINADIKAIEKAWREEMVRDTSIHKANLLAEIQEVKRKAWTDQSMDVVLRCLQQERALLGLDAPQKVAPTNPTGDSEYTGIKFIVELPEKSADTAQWEQQFNQNTPADNSQQSK